MGMGDSRGFLGTPSWPGGITSDRRSLITTVHVAKAPHDSLITDARYDSAASFATYLDSIVKNRDWWHDTFRLAKASDDHVTRANELPTAWKLLALSEDWCGDAVNILPYVARLVEAAATRLELRVLGRDANPDIMNTHLTGTSRSIPVVIALDATYSEHGWWGPRPRQLQEHALGEWWTLPKDERRLRIRTWYARDHGRQVLDELLQLLQSVRPSA